jgi:hypothetical protein
VADDFIAPTYVRRGRVPVATMIHR